MNKKYNCDICNYDTCKLSNYKKHLLTKKHVNNEKEYDINKVSKLEDSVCKLKDGVSKLEDNITCKYCKKKLVYKKNIYKHLKNCKEKEKQELEQDKLKLENEKHELETKLKNEELAKLELEKQNKEIQKDYNEALKIIMDSCMANGNNIINNNQTINQVYIMNNFNDAYNFKDLMAPPLTAEEIELIRGDEAITACCSILKLRCIDNIAVEKRPIHCIDKPRRKILLRENDEWIVDFAGKMMLQGVYPLVRTLFPIHPGTPLNDLVFNSKQLIDMERKENKIVDYVLDDICIKSNSKEIKKLRKLKQCKKPKKILEIDKIKKPIKDK